MTGRATEDALDALHGLLSGALSDELAAAIARSKDTRDDDGRLVPGQPINPQLLDKVMKFLASNGVNAPASSPRVDRLATQLEDLDLDAEASRGVARQ